MSRPNSRSRPVEQAGFEPGALFVFHLETDAKTTAFLSQTLSHLSTAVHPLTGNEINGHKNTGEALAIVLFAINRIPAWAGSLWDAINRLKRHGFHVIAFDHGITRWPIRKRCEPLLAGAATVLDCESPEFGSELTQNVDRTYQNFRKSRTDRRTLIDTMLQHGIVGQSECMLDIFASLLRISQLSDLPVLVTGETGCGKELLVRAIHRLDKKRHQRPLIAVNCAAISRELAESEFFGHRRGAFTGAERDRKGYFRAADGGVLFLDEIAELAPGLQEKLLRVLQDGFVKSVGDDVETPVDVRVLAATNRDLGKQVREGKFREDLYHRLTVLSVHVPPLRERLSDLQPLIKHFVQKHGFLAPEIIDVGEDFIEALALTDLPGNARQLENIVRNAMISHREDRFLTLNDLPPNVWRELSEPIHLTSPTLPEPADSIAPFDSQQPLGTLANMLASTGSNLAQCLAHCEKILVQRAMEQACGNQSETARILGITARSVYNKLRKHSLTS